MEPAQTVDQKAGKNRDLIKARIEAAPRSGGARLEGGPGFHRVSTHRASPTPGPARLFQRILPTGVDRKTEFGETRLPPGAGAPVSPGQAPLKTSPGEHHGSCPPRPPLPVAGSRA